MVEQLNRIHQYLFNILNNNKYLFNNNLHDQHASKNPAELLPGYWQQSLEITNNGTRFVVIANRSAWVNQAFKWAFVHKDIINIQKTLRDFSRSEPLRKS